MAVHTRRTVARPTVIVAVLACMDARLDPAEVLGLEAGRAHIIRNAGGVASEDAIRSLTISQRLVGTEEIILVHHTDCLMSTVDEAAVKEDIRQETGIRPSFALDAFDDIAEDVRQTAARLRASPFVRTSSMRGFVYDVDTGRLDEIALG
ncbi:MAG: beta-class carbonic anhydrase [Acidimicrobiia bacterium]